MRILTIIPARNEELSIAATVKSVVGYDVLVVDGTSSDNTAQVARDAGARVFPSKGKTYADAIVTGISRAIKERYDAVVIMDAESHTHSEIVPFLDDYDGTHIIAGNRKANKEKKSLFRRFVSFMARVINDTDIYDPTNGFRCYPIDFAKLIVEMHREFNIPAYAFNYAIAKVAKQEDMGIVYFPMSYRGGATGLTLRELVRAAVWIIRH